VKLGLLIHENMKNKKPNEEKKVICFSQFLMKPTTSEPDISQLESN